MTARDLTRFLRAVQAGRLLSPESTGYFFTPRALYRDRETWKKMYGPGLWFHVGNDATILFYEKEGSNAGTSGMVRHYPARDATLVLLCNMQDAAWGPAEQVHEMLLAGDLDG